jgi:hypothetical protein
MKLAQCQYYYGCGEDETLGDAIAVTIIATDLILNNKMEL